MQTNEMYADAISTLAGGVDYHDYLERMNTNTYEIIDGE